MHRSGRGLLLLLWLQKTSLHLPATDLGSFPCRNTGQLKRGKTFGLKHKVSLSWKLVTLARLCRMCATAHLSA